MSHRIQGADHHSRARLAAVTIGAGVLLLSGCAAGQISQTADQVAAVDGGFAQVGTISILNALLATPDSPAYAEGSDAKLFLSLSNAGHDADKVVTISTPAASKVTITNTETATAGDATLDGGLNVPADTLLRLDAESKQSVTLSGLTRMLCFGQSIPLTFTFAKAGAVTLNVPIANPAKRRGERETVNIQPAHPTPLWESGEHAKEHAEAPAAGSAHAEAAGSEAAASAAPMDLTKCNAGAAPAPSAG